MGEKLQITNHLVAFVDILGATKMIYEDQNKSLEIVHEAYDVARGLYKTIFEKRTRFKFKFFSDNIVIAISVKKEENFRTYFSYLSVMTSLIQLSFLMRNILVRGGVAYGGYFFDDLMIWGKALTRAYELENTIAIYPRIVIDPEIIDRLEVIANEKYTLNDFGLLRDFDNICYLNYFQERIIRDRPDFLQYEFKQMDKRIERIKDTKLLQKHYWHKNYILSKMNGL